MDNTSTIFFMQSNPFYKNLEINLIYNYTKQLLPLPAILSLTLIIAITLVYLTYYKAPQITEFLTLLLPFVITSNTLTGLTGLNLIPIWIPQIFQTLYILLSITYIIYLEINTYQKMQGNTLNKTLKLATKLKRNTVIWNTEEKP